MRAFRTMLVLTVIVVSGAGCGHRAPDAASGAASTGAPSRPAAQVAAPPITPAQQQAKATRVAFAHNLLHQREAAARKSP